MIDLSQVGAHVGKGQEDSLQLGIHLPNITADKGYRLFADIIHVRDQFEPSIPAVSVELEYHGDPYGHWTFNGRLGDLTQVGNMGQPGRYLYRYRLLRHGQTLAPYFADPFATTSGPGTLSAFDYPATPAHQWQDDAFSVPHLDDLIVYEMMVDDFADDFDGVIERLPYLKGLGVNCIELMPVTNIPEPYRWGYMPMSYFAIEERYGGTDRLKAFVDACHGVEIAVIHDAVYAHMHEEFCYRKVYWAAGEDNPMIGPFAEDMFGIGTDFNKAFAYAYFHTVNAYFLDELHLDGFRYDYVPGIYDGPAGKGYARLVFDAYQYSKNIARFQGENHSLIIQAAEYLDRPKAVLRETYTSASKRWWPMLKAQDMVRNSGSNVPESFMHDMLLIDIPDPWPQYYSNADTGDRFPVAPLQFIESHDKSRLMYILSGEHSPWHGGFDLFDRDRSRWYRMQPFAIALMTSVGVPMLWQGQEFGEIYGKHDDGGSRVLAARPLHWNYFYEPGGRALVQLYRKLGQLRHDLQALRSRNAYFHYEQSDLGRGLVAYQRTPDNDADPAVVVLINFGAQESTLNVPFPRGGRWTEQLNNAADEAPEILDLVAGQTEVTVSIPSNYGKVWVVS
ncbi:MAG: alpha-amylase family glycosyl hydrolase [Gammaproteobacteria bacterium]|nr:MAG: alpha-amylase family glycosyl hydrolase [Gammaproteobacteria bacterium]